MVIFWVCLAILIIVLYFIIDFKLTDLRDDFVAIAYHFMKNWIQHDYAYAKKEAKAEIEDYKTKKKHI